MSEQARFAYSLLGKAWTIADDGTKQVDISWIKMNGKWV